MDRQSVLLVQKWIHKSFNSKRKIVIKLVIYAVAPVTAFIKISIKYAEAHIHFVFHTTGTSSTSTTLTRKSTMRKSQRHSMNVIQDKHQKNDIPMWVCIMHNKSKPLSISFIHSLCRLSKCCAQPCFPIPRRWSARRTFAHFESIQKYKLHSWIRFCSIQFYYSRTPIQILNAKMEKMCIIVVLCQNIGTGNADLRA